MIPARDIVPGVLASVYRRAMRSAALLVHDIDTARRYGTPAPGDQGLRPIALGQAILWRNRAADAKRRSA